MSRDRGEVHYKNLSGSALKAVRYCLNRSRASFNQPKPRYPR